MINLIPNEEKKKMVRGFYLRLVAVIFMMLSFVAFIATASILPSYFTSNIKKNLALEKIEIQKKEPLPDLDQEALKQIGELKSKLILIENAEKGKFLVSDKVFREVISEKMPDISIYEISYKNDINLGKRVTIFGIAPSRERLLLFRKALEENPTFNSVDLPISNFIKGSNIRFSLSLLTS